MRSIDPGGRLGPHTNGNPDLRNMNVWYYPVQQDDIVLICTDGLYDNIDPENLGIPPSQLLQGQEDKWNKLDPIVAEQLKEIYSCKIIQDTFQEVLNTYKESNDMIKMEDFTYALLKHVKKKNNLEIKKIYGGES